MHIYKVKITYINHRFKKKLNSKNLQVNVHLEIQMNQRRIENQIIKANKTQT